MCIELKIKSKHLALEPKIIKHEECKLKGQIKYTKGKHTNVKLYLIEESKILNIYFFNLNL